MKNLKHIQIVLLIVIIVTSVKMQAEDYGSLIFKPLVANIYESRLGTIFTNNDKKLRLDIGGNYDFYHSEYSDNSRYGFGAEFFTYTRLRSEGNFKFPVETTDFYFGVNYSYEKKIGNDKILGRFRVAHISTHLSDGFSSLGIFNQLPFVYSKEFLDLSTAYNLNYQNSITIKPYIGLIYIFSNLPKDLNLLVPSVGLELNKPINNWISIVLAYDFKLNGFGDVELGMNNVVAGVRLSSAQNRGILIKAEAYSGEDYYGQFYKLYNQYIAFGFQLDY